MKRTKPNLIDFGELIPGVRLVTINAAVFSNAPLAAERPLVLTLVAGAVGVLIQPLKASAQLHSFFGFLNSGTPAPSPDDSSRSPPSTANRSQVGRSGKSLKRLDLLGKVTIAERPHSD